MSSSMVRPRFDVLEVPRLDPALALLRSSSRVCLQEAASVMAICTSRRFTPVLRGSYRKSMSTVGLSRRATSPTAVAIWD